MELLVIVMIVSIMMVSVTCFVTGKIVDYFCERRIKNMKPREERKRVFYKKKTLDTLGEAIKRKASTGHTTTLSDLDEWLKDAKLM